MSTIACEISQDAPLVRLLQWQENPHGLATLWDMLRVFADTFVKLIDEIKQAELELSGVVVPPPGSPEEHLNRARAMGLSVNALNDHCEHLRLKSAAKQVRSIIAFLSIQPNDLADLWRMFEELRRRVREDLEETVMYSMEPAKVDMFYFRETQGVLKDQLIRSSPEALWGQQVCSNFKSAIDDIKGASRCLSLDQGTACVFHLMRVMEVGLRALGKKLNDPKLDPKANPSWESILAKCDKELRQPYAQRAPEWQTDPDFFNEATLNLRAVKDVWRNPTMHVEKNYEYEEAVYVWNTVKAFMNHLSTRISE